METVALGSVGIRVSRLCVGALTIKPVARKHIYT